MNTESPRYISYLLRLWCAGSNDGSSWRAALENPHSGERQVFRDLADLFAFLEEKTLEQSRRPEHVPPVSASDGEETQEG